MPCALQVQQPVTSSVHMLEFVAEADRDQTVAGPVPRYKLTELFPVTLTDGFGDSNLAKERLFLRHLFPEMAAKGLLIDPSRKEIDTFKEKMVLGAVISCMCLVIILLSWLAEYEIVEEGVMD